MTWQQRWRRWTQPAWLAGWRRTRPISRHWGYDRGTPIDRYYIERFLEQHAGDIRGRVLEVKDRGYTERFGREVEQSDILDISPANSAATIVADLSAPHEIASDSFDCFILTQTLLYIYDVRAAVAHVHRILKPGGVLLATVPSITRDASISEGSPDYWRFTGTVCTRLFGEVFAADQLEISTAGNLASCVAFLQGLAAEDIGQQDLNHHDRNFPLIVTVRARKR